MLVVMSRIERSFLHHILHDVSVFAPVEYQAKVGDICRYSVERENVIMFELLY